MSRLAIIALFWLSIGCAAPVAYAQLPNDLEKRLLRQGHALLVGIANYGDSRWGNLPKAPEFITELKNGLTPHFETVDVLIDPTLDKLRSELRNFFQKSGDGDEGRLFVFYFGHGFTDLNPNTNVETGFITASDTPYYYMDKTAPFRAMSMHEYDTLTRISHARQILTVFDSCFSGTIFSTKLTPSSPTKMDLDRVRQSLRGAVRYYITAGRANEKVPADFRLHELILRGIAGDADLFKDGFVSGESLGLYLERIVPNMIGKLITPQYGAVNEVTLSRGQFIFRVTDTPTALPKPADQPQVNRPSSAALPSRFPTPDVTPLKREKFDLGGLFTIRRGTEAVGGEPFKVPSDVNTIEECGLICSASQACDLFTYGNRNKSCNLYPSADVSYNSNTYFDAGVRR
jgi:hypothetical protein